MTSGIFFTIMFRTSFTLRDELTASVTSWKTFRYSRSFETVFSKTRAFMIAIAAWSAIAVTNFRSSSEYSTGSAVYMRSTPITSSLNLSGIERMLRIPSLSASLRYFALVSAWIS
jgi:hypothetical protein